MTRIVKYIADKLKLQYGFNLFYLNDIPYSSIENHDNLNLFYENIKY